MHDLKTSDVNTVRCSFCHKSQDEAGKLISSARDSPRAYICDECVAVCAMIIEDDRPDQSNTVHPEAVAQRHAFLDHPLASDLLASLVEWFGEDSRGRPAAAQLEAVRSLMSRMIQA